MDKAESPGRWWEYYFVRYFLGTITGAVILVFVTKALTSDSYAFRFQDLKDIVNLKAAEITGLAALGFAYCYIASAPMLLWHATRAYLRLNPLHFRKVFWLVTVGVIAACYIGVGLWWSILWSYRGLSVLIFGFVVGIQVATLVAAHLDRFNVLTTFYVNLARARTADEQSVLGYVESYRHLREHGNSVAILVLEVALAFTLVSAARPALAVLLLVLWVLPSTYTWFIASVLEANLERFAKR